MNALARKVFLQFSLLVGELSALKDKNLLPYEQTFSFKSRSNFGSVSSLLKQTVLHKFTEVCIDGKNDNAFLKFLFS